MACPPLHLETSKNSQAHYASQVVWKLDTSALLPLAKFLYYGSILLNLTVYTLFFKGFSGKMAFIRKLSNLAVVASAAVTFSGAYIVYNSRRLPAHASGHRAGVLEELDRLLFEPSSVQWDSNWDLRETGTKKPRKKDSGIVENDVEVSKEIKPTGIRHLVFIRHGQYYDSAKKDEDKRLTELGRYRKNVLFVIHYKYDFMLIFDFIRSLHTLVIRSQPSTL